MKIYIVGQMTGIPDQNFPAFAAAAARWRAAGHEVISPAEMNMEDGFGSDNSPTPEDMRGIFANDVHAICFADALALLPGWRNSRFGRIEVQIGIALGLHLFGADTMNKVLIDPPAMSWSMQWPRPCPVSS